MRPSIIVMATAALALLVMGVALPVLPACGLRLPFGLGQWQLCPAPLQARAPADRTPERAALLAQIEALQSRLAALQCQPAPPRAAEAPPEPPPETPLPPQTIEEGDVAALEGCWALASSYGTVDPKTGAAVAFAEWQLCFDASGAGQEKMRGTDGTTCEGPVQAGFDAEGALVIDEPGDLACSNGYSIYRRQVRCTVNGAGIAQCQSLQAEVGGDLAVIMRRAKEQP